MVLPYGILLTRLFRHVGTYQPYLFTSNYTLTPHAMVPLSEERVKRTVSKGKRAHPLSDSSLSDDSNLPNLNLSPQTYIKELSHTKNRSVEFKQTKGMFKFYDKAFGKMKSKK
ncbi:hypothetical protein Tco_0703515 [Tanacetum coccineum]|uniref:Uncharacterized protein n=1 Tax=Tanacetum coccineum TaxID=301880 RepID=A0ABQ4XZ10_9ASTR